MPILQLQVLVTLKVSTSCERVGGRLCEGVESRPRPKHRVIQLRNGEERQRPAKDVTGVTGPSIPQGPRQREKRKAKLDMGKCQKWRGREQDSHE